jgi:hypothetical protein
MILQLWLQSGKTSVLNCDAWVNLYAFSNTHKPGHVNKSRRVSVMLSFFWGLTTGVMLLLNGRIVRRGFAKAVLNSGDAAVSVGRQIRRVSAGVVADLEDAFAEVKSETASAKAEREAMAALHAELQGLRTEIASLYAENPGLTVN